MDEEDGSTPATVSAAGMAGCGDGARGQQLEGQGSSTMGTAAHINNDSGASQKNQTAVVYGSDSSLQNPNDNTSEVCIRGVFRGSFTPASPKTKTTFGNHTS